MNIWTKILFVALGGALGSVSRLLLSMIVRTDGVWIGLGTWIINTVGCFLIGIFAGWLLASGWSPWAKTAFGMLLMTGFCGGFSTFSAYTLDCVKYIEAGHVGMWIVFMIATVFSGLFFCALGYWLGSKL